MNRNSKLLSIFAVVFALALSMALAGCGQQASSSAASSAASSESASAAASDSASAASDSASAESASAAASDSASAASASSAAADEVAYSLVVDATDADLGVLYDESGTAAKGTTVYQALIETGLPLEVDSSSGGAYVSGIGDAIANDGKAGWLFTVNGEMPSVGADKVEIADGDAIEWKFYKDASKAM